MRDAYRAKPNATTLAGFPPALAATAGRLFPVCRRKSGRARHAAGALAALPLVLVCLFAGATGASAQTDGSDVLVSNTNQAMNSGTSSARDRAQAFTTGSSTLGYTLSSVEIVSQDSEADDAAVSVCTVDASGHPTSELHGAHGALELCGRTVGVHRSRRYETRREHDLHAAHRVPWRRHAELGRHDLGQ